MREGKGQTCAYVCSVISTSLCIFRDVGSVCVQLLFLCLGDCKRLVPHTLVTLNFRANPVVVLGNCLVACLVSAFSFLTFFSLTHVYCTSFTQVSCLLNMDVSFGLSELWTVYISLVSCNRIHIGEDFPLNLAVCVVGQHHPPIHLNDVVLGRWSAVTFICAHVLLSCDHVLLTLYLHLTFANLGM